MGSVDDDGEYLGKLDYLRGPHGQRDRETLWAGGLGRLPGTGEGGLMIDNTLEKAHTVTAGRDKKQTAQVSQNTQAALTSTTGAPLSQLQQSYNEVPDGANNLL